MQDCSVLCHGELIPSNILINTESGNPYVLDWSHASHGEPEMDAAITYVLLYLSDPSGTQSSIYLRDYCEQSGCSSEKILGYAPTAAGCVLSACRKNEKSILNNFLGGLP